MAFGGRKSQFMKNPYDKSLTINGILQISIHLGFSNSGVGTSFLSKPKPLPNFCSISVIVFSGVGTSFLSEPKPIPNFCSISVIVFSGVGLVEPMLSMTHRLNPT